MGAAGCSCRGRLCWDQTWRQGFGHGLSTTPLARLLDLQRSVFNAQKLVQFGDVVQNLTNSKKHSNSNLTQAGQW